MATYAYTFQSGDGVTPTRLNDARTVSDIVNADIKSDAAIAHSKLANITAGQVLLGNASNVPTATAMTGDVTVTSGGVTAIGSAKVVTSMINNAAVTAAKLNGAQTGNAPIFGCRAWVNFDAKRDSSGASNTNNTNRFIRAQGNVASVLRNGAGSYAVTFTEALPSNCCVVGNAHDTTGAGVANVNQWTSANPTGTSTADVFVCDVSNVGQDVDVATFMFIA